MVEQLELNRDEDLLYRANSDIVQRSLTGCFIYLLIWFAIVLPNRFYETSPMFFAGYTTVFVLIAVVRIILIFNYEKIYRKSAGLWRVLFFTAVWLPASTWGVLCATALVHPDFEPLSLIILISTAGITGGGVAAIIPNRILTIGFISGLLIPSIVILFSSDRYNFSLSLVFCIYWIGMYSVTKIQHKEYWQSLHTSYLLQEYASDLQQKNTLDGLTGLKNRSFLDEYLTKEFKKSIRFESMLALILIDIDYFKNINDEHGHLVGDECLRQLAQQLQLMVKRETDVVARYGGEEFAIILPGMSHEETLTMAHKIRETIEGFTVSYDGVSVSMTVSIGVSCILPEFGQSVEEIIAHADKALYVAKESGRNQVMSAD